MPAQTNQTKQTKEILDEETFSDDAEPLDDREVKTAPDFELIPAIHKMLVSPTLGINLYAQRQRTLGRQIAHFGLGESPFGAPRIVQDALAKNAFRTSYLSSEGIPELREEVAKFYKRYFGITTRPEQIIIAPGSKQLIYTAMITIATPWLIPRPSWVSYVTQTKIARTQAFRVPIYEEGNLRITEKSLRKRYNDIIQSVDIENLIMLINYPNNPTGLTIGKDEVKRIARFARNNELMILSDEIYANVTHPSFGERHHSMALEYPEGTIVTGGMSKDRSMGGWRVGVAILPDENPHLVQAFKSIGSETYSCVPAPIQYAAIEGYKDNSEIDAHIRDSTQIHNYIGQWVYERLNKAGFRMPPPEGAFYLFPSLNHVRDELSELGIETSLALVNYILHKYHVVLLEGTAFGMPKEDLYFRLAYVDYNGDEVLATYRKDPDELKNNASAFIREHAPYVYKGINSLVRFATTIM